MNERRDDTTEPGAESRPAGDYYYDDATGYELYTPEEAEAEEAERGGAERPPEGAPGGA